MKEYLSQSFDLSSPAVISAFDELPLWSSYFGAVLLEQIPVKNNSTILDIGCGTGFPVIEIAQRSGNESRVFGIDPWSAAIERLNKKLELMCIKNVKIIERVAEELPFDNNYFDLIVSNNGINNVNDSVKVMKECLRVLKEDGQLVFTVNLPGTMKEFYSVFRRVLIKFGMSEKLIDLDNHIFSKRKTLQMNIDMISGAGLTIEKIVSDDFRMRFADGTAMLNHYFIKLAFLESWKNLIPENQHAFFEELEIMLNRNAELTGELSLTVPFACFCCRKSKFNL